MKKKGALILASFMLVSTLSACQKEDPTLSATRDGWFLSAPAYMGGTLAFDVYNTGMGLDLDPTNKAGDMQIIYDTTRKDFDDYLYKTQNNGYQEVVRREINGNIFVEYQKDNALLYTYFNPAFQETRVIEDKVSVAETDFEYAYTQTDEQTTTIYQYALMNDPYGRNNKTTGYADNGMFYIIRQANNKLILVDGGSAKQAPDSAVDKLLEFLYEITGKNESEKIEISAFILTHAHGDHKQMVQKLIQNHAEKLDIERILFNVPWHVQQSSFVPFGTLLQEKFPNAKYLKAHTGQSLALGEVTLDIMLTHEDLVEKRTGMTNIATFNNTTTVIKYTINGKTFMQLGDHTSSQDHAGERFLGLYKAGENDYPALKSDIVQVAHHAIETAEEDLYNAICAPYAFVPQADCDFEKYKSEQAVCDKYWNTLGDLKNANESVEFFFQSRYTHGFTIAKNGTLSKTTPIAIQGVNEDYAGYLTTVDAFVR